MIRYYALEQGRLTALEALQPGCWINIDPPIEQEELESLANQFNFAIDYLIDSLDIDERSRYERDEDLGFILVNTPILNEVDQENEAIYVTIPIGILLLKDYIVTISGRDNPVLNRFFEGKVRNFDPSDFSLFVLQIFEQNVLYFLSCLKKLNLKRNLIEKELYNSSRNEELKQLLRIEKSLVFFVNTLSANELLKMKMKRSDFLKISDDEDKSDLFEDIIIDNGQALEMANVYTNILNGTMEAYASIVSNNLNVFIQRLTIVTVVLMVPTLVASFYGMNVPVPFQRSERSFYWIVIFSVVISVLLVGIFRRKRLF
ncbi:MAG: magnesium transporter CorA family protein [Saprospiraceae bacterium]|nr:magnesium transporter CorA family protein [Saprospiraceae bacterium]MCB9318934.1 magnesium transporter CorA family protein [Lewinellaceae bacterium]